MDATPEDARFLLIDSCGGLAEIALAKGNFVVSSTSLPDRTASALSLTAIRDLLVGQNWELTSLHAVGLVSGPGSFTGVRIGMALAKGLCEALHLPLLTLSRLQLLREAAAAAGVFAALDAGRDEVYVRNPDGKESVCAVDAFAVAVREDEVAVLEAKLAQRLEEFQPHISVSLVGVSLANALPHFQRELLKQSANNVLSEPHYVGGEASIYPAQVRKSSELIVREFTSADVAAVVGVQQECSEAPQWNLAVWERLAGDVRGAEHARQAVIAEEGPSVAGFAVVLCTLDECEVETLAVAPAFRRRGVGRILLRHALEAAAQAGARRAQLEVRSSNAAARALYRSLGFRADGQRKAYYRNPVEDATLLSAVLPLLPPHGTKV